ncbi:hypothetical protein DFH06DRAFT_1345273 [Mycena polygramma]|nr:hypothetical protein DFH06DRAFT_1345273 [Mycena polygramma]
MSSNNSTTRSRPVSITQTDPRCAPNSYSVTLRPGEGLERHLELLNEYVKSCPIETHDNVGFMICSTQDLQFDGAVPGYSALLPPIIVKWVQSRPEVDAIVRSVELRFFDRESPSSMAESWDILLS